MAVFITNKGGTNKFAMEFVISSDYLKLRLDVDISLLDNTSSYLFINAMDLFKLWVTHNHMSQKDSYITHPHMFSKSVITRNKWKQKVYVKVFKTINIPPSFHVLLFAFQYYKTWFFK